MGAAAGKQFQSEKAKHAAIILEVFRDYEGKHNSTDDPLPILKNAEQFKRRILLAASDAKKQGKDIDKILSQLTDSDFSTLFDVINSENPIAEAKNEFNSLTANDKSFMNVEEFNEEDSINHQSKNGNIDDTTSLLSYGEEESEVEESRNILQDFDTDASMTPIKHQQAHDDHIRKGLKLSAGESYKEPDIAETIAKFWEIEEINSISSLRRSSADEDFNNKNNIQAFSPVIRTPRKKHEKGSNSNPTSLSQQIDATNEVLLGLQRQKVLSYTQNLQLEQEVFRLQQQLEKLEKLERSLTRKPEELQGHTESRMDVSAVSINNSYYRSNRSSNGSEFDFSSPRSTTSNSVTNKSRTNKSSSNRASYIYPIDEDDQDEISNNHQHQMPWQRQNSASELKSAQKNKSILFNSSDSEDSTQQTTTQATARQHTRRQIEAKQRRGSDAEDDTSQQQTAEEADLKQQSRQNSNSSLAERKAHRLKRLNRNISSNSNNLYSNQNNANDTSDESVNSTNQQLQHQQYRSQHQVAVLKSDSKDSISSNYNHLSNKLGEQQTSRSLRIRPNANALNHAQSNIAAEKPSHEQETQESQSNIERRSKLLKKSNRRRHSSDDYLKLENNKDSAEKNANNNQLKLAILSKVNSQLSSNLHLNDLENSNDNVSVGSNQSNQQHPAKNHNRPRDINESINNTPRKKYQKLPGEDISSALSTTPRRPLQVNPSQELSSNKKNPVRRRPRHHQQQVSAASDAASNSNHPNNSHGSNSSGNGWSGELESRWSEVNLLLKKPIRAEEDLLYTIAAVEAGIIFIEQMENIAGVLQVLRGQLSRWILPYDNNTRIDTQCSTPHSVIDNMPLDFRGKLTERQVHYLVAGANGVRKLIRIKIADDNDLEQAKTALKTADKFFKLLYLQAQSTGVTPFDMLKLSGDIH